MKTTSKTLQYRQKKEKNRLTGSSQVYGRQALEKATEIGLYRNASCTLLHVVDDLFTKPRVLLCRIRGGHAPIAKTWYLHDDPLERPSYQVVACKRCKTIIGEGRI